MSLLPKISDLADKVRDKIDASSDKSQASINNKIWEVIRGAGIGECQKHRYFIDIQRERNRRAVEAQRAKAEERRRERNALQEAQRRYP